MNIEPGAAMVPQDPGLPLRREDIQELEQMDERRRLRRLQLMVQMVTAVLAQSGLTIEEAEELVAATRRAALNLFPGKEQAFDLLYRPRFQRIIRERFGL